MNYHLSNKISNRKLTRRRFLSGATVSASALATGTWFGFEVPARAQGGHPGNPLRLPPDWAGEPLTVAHANLAIWPGFVTAVSAINGSVPGPTIRVRRGDEFAARIANQLAEPLVLHWHGILAPEHEDGHPRDQVAAGKSYDVRFRVKQRAATCWYHAHTDQLTAEQAYRGVAGLFIIEDPAEVALGLPTGDHDLPLVLTDKRTNAQRQVVYAPSMMDMMTGYLGDLVLVNGTPDAWLAVDRGLYRFRLLNGSNARIYRVALSDGRQFHLVGMDGGLIPAPVSVSSVMLAPGQRLEILVDFSSYPVGSALQLKSLSFTGGGGMMGGTQGVEMDLMRFYVDGAATGNASQPSTLLPFTSYDSALARRTRVFTLASSGMVHTINGQLFSMSRVDFSVPFADLEIWEYRNTTSEYHPMHAHAAHCQILSRSSAAQLPPEDYGWKDTVLVKPNETVRILVRFDSHAGVFAHHCHNLEHEDGGMMQNFEVLPAPTLSIRRGGDFITVSWPDSASGWLLESTLLMGEGEDWQPVTQTPAKADGKWSVTLPVAGRHQFFRLKK